MDRIAAYVRVSTAKQAEENSHVRQRETIEKWAEETLDGDVQIDFYEDIAESGQNLSREAHKELMGNCPNYDAVVVRELSRFGRSMQKLLADIEELQECDCDFISIKDEEIDTSTAQGQLLFHIIAAFNQFWADLSRERTEEMIERRREEGKLIGRPKKLSDDQILELYELNRKNGYSLSTLAAIAESKNWVESISRQTIYSYMEKVDEGEI